MTTRVGGLKLLAGASFSTLRHSIFHVLINRLDWTAKLRLSALLEEMKLTIVWRHRYLTAKRLAGMNALGAAVSVRFWLNRLRDAAVDLQRYFHEMQAARYLGKYGLSLR